MRKLRIALLTCLIGLAAAPWGFGRTARAQEPDPNRATLDYPRAVRFTYEYDGATPLADAELTFDVEKFSCVDVQANVSVAVDDATLTYDWVLTRAGNVPPGSVLWWEWTVTDTSGRTFTTPRETVTFTDDRFEWQVVSAEGVHLHWYGRSDIGPRLLDAAVAGLHRLESEMGIELQDDVNLFVYDSGPAMREALLFVQGWAGGVAFSEYNTILLGIAPDEVDGWGVRVVAHELAHLVIGQFGRSCVGGSRPTWLEEGLAMVAEGEPESETLEAIAAGAAENSFEPLRSLTGAFPAHFGDAVASYSQSYSVVDFLLDEYGADSLQALIMTLAGGAGYDDALETVYGFNMDGLELAWRAALGAPVRTVPPTPTPILPQNVPTIAPLTIARAVPTPGAYATPAAVDDAPDGGFSICGIGLAPLLGVVGWVTVSRRRRGRS